MAEPTDRLVKIKQIAGGHAVVDEKASAGKPARIYKNTVPGDVFVGPESLIRRSPDRFVYADTGSPFSPPESMRDVNTPAAPPPLSLKPDPRKPLDQLPEAELRTVAADEEVDVTKCKTRDQVLKALKDAGVV